MNEKSIAGIGLAFVLATSSLAACSEGGTAPQDDQGTTGGAGGGGGSSAGGSAGSVSGGTSAGATAGGSTNGGSGGSVGGGTGGIPGGGSGGDGAGLGGVSPGGASPGGADPGGASPGGSSSGGSGGAGGGSTDVTVQLGQVRQTMAGFGINNNWAPAMTDAEADLMFNTTGNGMGMSILRIGMGSNGEPFNGANCYLDINKARARGVTTFIGTLWTPPASYKTNNSENDGGRLRPERYEDWANTIAAFPAKIKQNTQQQVDLYGMSPQNETDFASCGLVEPCNGNYPTTIFNGSEYVAFLKVVGPKLKALNPPVRVIGPEASEWLHVWSNESATGSEPSNRNSSDPLRCGFPATMCAPGQGYDYGHALYADQTAWGLLDIMGVHQYDTQVAEPWPADVPSRKPVWQTEMSGVKWWPEQGPSTHIDNGIAVAGWIHNALTVGEASAWLWWWWKAISTDDNEGFYTQNGSGGWTDTKRRHTFTNYSRFIRPGYIRVEITGAIPTDVLLTAFKGTDGTVVIVAINKGNASATVPITIAGGTVPASLTPYVTSASDNFASKTAVMVSGGAFMATLASKTVTTFVGR